MISSSVPRRYARALFALGTEDGRFEGYLEELGRVSATVEQSAELRDLWLNPVHGREVRQRSVDVLAEQLGLSPATANLLRLLVERGRLDSLEAIVRAYRELVDAQVGRVRAVVTSAIPLGAESTGHIGEVLARATGRQIVLESRVDAGLLGGVVAQVGSTVLDGSLRTQLARLRQELERAPLEEEPARRA